MLKLWGTAWVATSRVAETGLASRDRWRPTPQPSPSAAQRPRGRQQQRARTWPARQTLAAEGETRYSAGSQHPVARQGSRVELLRSGCDDRKRDRVPSLIRYGSRRSADDEATRSESCGMFSHRFYRRDYRHTEKLLEQCVRSHSAHRSECRGVVRPIPVGRCGTKPYTT